MADATQTLLDEKSSLEFRMAALLGEVQGFVSAMSIFTDDDPSRSVAERHHDAWNEMIAQRAMVERAWAATCDDLRAASARGATCEADDVDAVFLALYPQGDKSSTFSRTTRPRRR